MYRAPKRTLNVFFSLKIKNGIELEVLKHRGSGGLKHLA